MNRAWNEVLCDARRDWRADGARRVNWDAVDKQLFERIEKEERAERQSLLSAPGRRWGAIVGGLAIAAAMAVLAGGMRERRPLELDRASTIDDAANIVAIDGTGEVLVGGRLAGVGTPLRLGDVVETRGAQATLSRPGKLVLVLEQGSSVTVTHAQRTLVLVLSRGAVEAQVVPIPNGEALAVDVGRSRIAVHGTHVRVARIGQEVVVDLNEGVVSVGEAPRSGSTWGGLVTAPAHAQFFTEDAERTLRITHDLAVVRAPSTRTQSTQLRPAPSAAPQPLTPSRAEVSGETASAPVAMGPRTESRTPMAEASAGAAGPATDSNAEAAVIGAVRACMAKRLHADDVTVVVSTTLYLQLYDDGSVRAARFEPPVAPDVNSCAAQSIYGAHFQHGGSTTIRVSVKS